MTLVTSDTLQSRAALREVAVRIVALSDILLTVPRSYSLIINCCEVVRSYSWWSCPEAENRTGNKHRRGISDLLPAKILKRK